MNIMAARVPALIFPYAKQQEQPLRVAKINKYIPMQSLHDKDIEPTVLSRYIQEMLLEPRPTQQIPINLDGAENTAQYLMTWLGGQFKP